MSAVDVGGEILVMAADLAEGLLAQWGLQGQEILKVRGRQLEGAICRHPWIERDSQVILANYVTLEAGTGLVHIAPGHGQDDYVFGRRYGLEPYSPVDDGGRFTDEVPEFAGQKVEAANPGIIELLRQKGKLLSVQEMSHSYPALLALQEAHHLPGHGAVVHLHGEKRPAPEGPGRDRPGHLDPPLGPGAHLPDGGAPPRLVHLPAALLGRAHHRLPLREVRRGAAHPGDHGRPSSPGRAWKGADFWFADPADELLPPGTQCTCGAADFRKETDILDVWFDSGVSWAAVLEPDPALGLPADLYLEGSDQHRGWFHSSLLTSVGTRGQAPYKGVLTHGFVVDGDGRKMSKSLGNVIAPQEVMNKYGAEILRLWVAAEDYRDDVRLSPDILKQLADAYRRFRNTCRFMLGNLYDFDPEVHLVPPAEREELDRLALSWLAQLLERVKRAYGDYEFHQAFHRLHQFCAVEMSAIYLDILKDRLYVSAAGLTGAAERPEHLVGPVTRPHPGHGPDPVLHRRRGLGIYPRPG